MATDVSVEISSSRGDELWIWECLDRDEPVDVSDLETFAGKVRDLGATRGAVVSRGSFTEEALEWARHHSIGTGRFLPREPGSQPPIKSATWSGTLNDGECRFLLKWIRNLGRREVDSIDVDSVGIDALLKLDQQLNSGLVVLDLRAFISYSAQFLLRDYRRKRQLEHWRQEPLDAVEMRMTWPTVEMFDQWGEDESIRLVLGSLSAEDRNLLLRYFGDNRTALASQLGLTSNALRVRVSRIVSKLRKTFAAPK